MRPQIQLMGLTLPGSWDSALAIAVSRAGELGVLNLEYTRDPLRARSVITQFVERSRNHCCIRIDGRDPQFLLNLISVLPKQLTHVILVPGDTECLADQIHRLKTQHCTVLLEIISEPEALLGERLG